MIEGIKFDIKGSELGELFLAKAAYHTKRAETQSEELPKLKAIIESLKVPAYQQGGSPGMTYGNSSYANSDPIADLEKRIGGHRAQASKLRFYGEHAAKDETYRLAPSDLGLLGLDDDAWMQGFFAVRR